MNIHPDVITKEQLEKFFNIAYQQATELRAMLEAQEILDREQIRRFLPEGGTGCWSEYDGVCLSCGLEKKKEVLLYRDLMLDDDGNPKGPKVCRLCSPHISDETVYRYTQDMDGWDARWLNHLDANTQVFSGTVVCIN